MNNIVPTAIRPMQMEDILATSLWVSALPLMQRYGASAERLQQHWLEAIERGELLRVVERADTREVCGFAWCDPRGGFSRSAYLRFFAVHPDTAGMGIGRLLLTHIEETCKGFSEDLFLLTSDFNSEAQTFYKRCGYEQVGSIEAYVLPDVTELIYRKRLQRSR